MKDKKWMITFSLVIVGAIIATVGLSYAYFVASVGGTGNDATATTVTTEVIGSIKFEGEQNFTSTELYPGEIGVQVFTIEAVDTKGIGKYRVNLTGTVPTEFGSDVQVSLYKTTDTLNNNVAVTKGVLTQTGNQYSRIDTLNVVGSPELIYPAQALTANTIELELTDYDCSTLAKTTYYLVYDYKNNGKQDAQQGLTFGGKVTVELVNIEA